MGTLNARLPISPDAFANLFVVNIAWNANFVDEQKTALLQNDLRWRIKDFTPPELKTDVKTSRYWTIEAPRQGSKIEGQPTFKIRFRVDANYRIFLLMQKAKRSFSGSLGPEVGHQYGNPINELSVKVPIQGDSTDATYAAGLNMLDYLENTFDSDDPTAGYLWVFRNVFVTEVSNPTYTTGEAGVLESEVTFYFDPFTSSYPYQFLDNQNNDATFSAYTQNAADRSTSEMQQLISQSAAQNPSPVPKTGIPGQQLTAAPITGL